MKRNVEILFSKLSLPHGKVKCCRNADFEKMDTECSTGKIMDFEYCEEYLRSTSNKILLWQCYEKQILIQLSFAD